MADGEITKREFNFKLSPDEVEQRKARHLAVERDIDEEMSAKSAEMSARNETLRSLRKDRKALIGACTTGHELREVDVRESWSFQTNRVVFVRVDTGEEIEERAMDSAERQESLFDEDGKPAPELETAKKNGRGKKSKGKNGAKATTDKPVRARARKGRVEAVED